MQVEFVDRYTGDPRGRPTAFNACHECEAMGWDITKEPQAGAEPDEDGYYWTHCKDCGGSGRVSVWRNLPRRLPRWLWKGLRFIWDTNVGYNRACRAPWHTRRQHFALTFKCAYLVDLGLWKP